MTTRDRDALYYIDGPTPQTPEPSEYPAPWKHTEVVGQRRPRIDAYERVSGSAVYPSDELLPDMLYGAILRCPHAHAKVTKLDASAAAEMPGVAAVLTGADPEADLVWPYGRGDSSKLFVELCRHEGDAVAAVAAETPQRAADAVRAIEVEYEILPHVSDERRALEEGAPQIRDKGNQQGGVDRYSRGDLEQGFAEADVVLEESYRCEYQLHTPMELHGCVAKWDRDRLTVWESTQGVYPVQSGLAQALGLALAKVRVIGHYMGGGFGSKLQPGKYTIIAALLARKTARPVKLFLSREETLLCTGNRPGANMTIKAGVKKDGTLTALSFTSTSSAGGYVGGGAGLLDWQVRELYLCPNVSCENTLAFINAGPSRPMRAPGHPQGSWALEQMLDALAAAIDMDPVKLRLKNVPSTSQMRRVPYTSTGLAECLTKGAEEFGWKDARKVSGGDSHIKRGVGMAACTWVVGGGGPPATIIVKLFADGSVNLNMGASDIGTGTKTVMSMVVAEELGLDPDQIQVEHADTATTQFATASGGSKTVPTESPAVREAAYKVARQLIEMAADQLKVDAADLALRHGEIVSRSDPDKKVAVTALARLRQVGVVVGVGYRGPNPEGKTVNPFAAQFCEVEVNTRTGEVKLLRFLGAHESGRVLNRLTFDNQVFGGIAMGIGFGMIEARVLDEEQTGKMVNLNLHDYKIPTALDVPADMASVVIDPADYEANTTAAKGVGEPVTIPTAPAIANAVYDAVGIRVTDTPLNAVQLVRLLAEQKKEA
jgi:xanthine dehydrogenase YagR molybdenum-binding subunit